MNEVVQTVYSVTGRHRARIVKVSETTFRIDIDRQHEADIDDFGHNHGPFWSRFGGGMSYADTLDRALILAEENLRNCDAIE
jgi:hypothetical protein